MAIVYRIEHPSDGHGPWWSNKTSRNNDASAILAQKLKRVRFMRWSVAHPPWREDAIERVDNPRSACPDLRTLLTWFYHARGWLEKEGYVVAVYIVPAGSFKAGASGKQIVFDLKKAHKLRTFPVRELASKVPLRVPHWRDGFRVFGGNHARKENHMNNRPTFLAMMRTLFKPKEQALGEFAAELNALDDNDRNWYHQQMIAGGHDCEPPKPVAAAA